MRHTRAADTETQLRMLCARVPVVLHYDVKILAARRRSSVQAIATEAIEAYLLR